MVWAVVVVGPFVAWFLFRGRGYKRVPLERPPDGPGWRRTAERSVDPATGALIEVWFDADTGARAYVRLTAGQTAARSPPGTV